MRLKRRMTRLDEQDFREGVSAIVATQESARSLIRAVSESGLPAETKDMIVRREAVRMRRLERVRRFLETKGGDDDE